MRRGSWLQFSFTLNAPSSELRLLARVGLFGHPMHKSGTGPTTRRNECLAHTMWFEALTRKAASAHPQLTHGLGIPNWCRGDPSYATLGLGYPVTLWCMNLRWPCGHHLETDCLSPLALVSAAHCSTCGGAPTGGAPHSHTLPTYPLAQRQAEDPRPSPPQAYQASVVGRSAYRRTHTQPSTHTSLYRTACPPTTDPPLTSSQTHNLPWSHACTRVTPRHAPASVAPRGGSEVCLAAGPTAALVGGRLRLRGGGGVGGRHQRLVDDVQDCLRGKGEGGGAAGQARVGVSTGREVQRACSSVGLERWS